MPFTDEEKAVKIFALQHPFYTHNIATWKRNKAAYDGGKKYLKTALIKHLAEFHEEYAERLERAYYFNFPRKVIRLLTQYVLSVRPQRKDADSSICEDFNRSGQSVDEIMRQFSIDLRLYGVAFLQIDMPSFAGIPTKAREQKERLRPYCFVPSPESVKAWAYGSDGKLLWVCTEESLYCQEDPFTDGQNILQRKLWTRQDCTIARKDADGKYTLSGYFEHNLGIVPFVRRTEADGYAIGSSHWFEDIVGISDAILNNESEAQMNIVKQMFALLVLPEDFVAAARARIQDLTDSDSLMDEKREDYIKKQLDLVIARGVAITESTESKGTSRYITPPGVEIEKISEKNNHLIKQLYALCCLATDKDTKLVESADAKMWDFQAIEQHLATHADMLENAEAEAWKIMQCWKKSLPVPDLNYNRNFTVLQLTESISALLELYGMNQDSKTYQQECGKAALSMLGRIRQMPQDIVEKILKEIESASVEKSLPSGDNWPYQEPEDGKEDVDDPVTK